MQGVRGWVMILFLHCQERLVYSVALFTLKVVPSLLLWLSTLQICINLQLAKQINRLLTETGGKGVLKLLDMQWEYYNYASFMSIH